MELPVPGVDRNERLLVGLPLFGAYTMAAVIYLSAATTGELRSLVANGVLLLVAAGAAIACFRRARQDGGRADWLLFGLAAVAAAASHVIWAWGGTASLGSWLLLASYVSFTAGTAAQLQRRDPAALGEFALDALLIIAAAAVAIMRWAPAAHAVVSDPGALPLVVSLSVVISSVAAVSSLFFALVPLAEAGGPVLLGVAGAAVSFSVATLPLATEGVECCREGNPLALVTILGWTSVVFAALSAEERQAAQPWPHGWRLRHLIAPSAAILLAVVLVDVALRPPMRQPTALVLGGLGIFLALRFVQLLRMTQEQGRDRRELAQARALIEVSNTLTAETELNATLADLTLLTCKLLRAKASAVELLVEDGATLELKATAGLPHSAVGMRFPVESSFTGWVVQHGQTRSSADPTRDPFFSRESAQLLGPSPVIAAPLRHRGATVGVISCIGDEPFSEEDGELLQAIADQAAVAIENTRLFQQVNALSLTDPLTRLANRRQLERDLKREFAAARRGRQLVAVMFDLNGFKAYNDMYGHLAGDRALCAFADALAHETRAMNLAARYGGDEFLVLLADADTFGARVFVERVRQQFEQAMGMIDRGTLTVEAGIAEFSLDMKSEDELVARADRALYQAKAARSSR